MKPSASAMGAGCPLVRSLVVIVILICCILASSPVHASHRDPAFDPAEPPQDDPCGTDTLLLSTGVDPVTGAPLSPGSLTGIWTVVEDPMPETIEPRPAMVIRTFNGWAEPAAGSLWITSYDDAVNGLNGTYVFEHYFCLKEGSHDPSLHLTLLADDRAMIYLNGTLLGSTRPSYAFRDPALVLDRKIGDLVRPGANILRIEVLNTNSVAMGLDLGGYLAADDDAFLRPECCDLTRMTGTIIGTKFLDRNCNGLRDDGEPGLSDWTIRLDNGATATTDKLGVYRFSGVPPGNRTVEEVQRPGWRQSMPPAGGYSVMVDPGKLHTGLDFGNCFGTGMGECIEPLNGRFRCATRRGMAYCFRVRNLMMVPLASVRLSSISPAGIAFMPETLTLDPPLDPGSLSDELCLSIADPLPMGTPLVVSMRVIGTDGSICIRTDTVPAAPASDVYAGEDVVICSGDTVRLHALGRGDSVDWSGGPLDCDTCHAPLVFPDSTTSYILWVKSPLGCTWSDTVRVRVLPRLHLLAHIPRDLKVRPGESLVVPVVVDAVSGGWPLDGGMLTVRYDPGILRLDSLVIAGTLLEGGSIREARGEGEVRATLAPPADAPALRPGTLLYLAFTGFLGDTLISEFPFELSIPESRCGEIALAPGSVAIDSVCGLSFRMIELIPESYALDGSEPNPADERARISFSLGLDGPARLAVYDAEGREVERLIDEYLRAGRYMVEWDTSRWPAGLYYCRLASGEWSATRKMMIAR